ncbi:MAG: efflux RND transporter periplasmic adaptor subunit, partial [Calditrichaeota bacterium]|nr:efflux RND transporter periplasmic adaptor subunit [Calditrichota bacterium]
VQPQPVEIPRKLVRVMTVEKQTVGMTVRSQGNVVPRTESMLVAEAAGRVITVSPAFVAGGFFEAGEVLITLDPSDYELALTQAKSQVAQAELAYQIEEQQGRIARDEWRRLNQGEIPPLVAREPQLNQARANLEAARANLRKAELNLERTRIRAPFVGRLRSKNVDVGQYVAPGSPLAMVYAVDYVEVRLPVSDDALAYIDMPFNFRGERNRESAPKVILRARFAGQDQSWEGYLSRIEGEIDPQSRMIYLVARVEDPYGQRRKMQQVPLTVGLFVEAEIFGRQVSDVVEIPRAALRNGSQVLVVDDQERLYHREVEVIREEGDIAYLRGGLQAGEKICISPLAAVVDGMPVTIVLDDSTPSVSQSGSAGEVQP